MNWHYYQKSVDEKQNIYDFIDSVIYLYGSSKSFSVYQKINGRELLIFLETDDTEISRRFINFFIDGVPLFGNKPTDFDSLTKIY
jgi:hypothetical protein